MWISIKRNDRQIRLNFKFFDLSNVIGLSILSIYDLSGEIFRQKFNVSSELADLFA